MWHCGDNGEHFQVEHVRNDVLVYCEANCVLVYWKLKSSIADQMSQHTQLHPHRAQTNAACKQDTYLVALTCFQWVRVKLEYHFISKGADIHEWVWSQQIRLQK